MDGRKRWADNIMVERWFRSLKQEEIYINYYRLESPPSQSSSCAGKLFVITNYIFP